MGDSEVTEPHQPCPHCASSDAYASYSDGHGYCFSCQTYDPAAAGPSEEPKQTQQKKGSKKGSKDKTLIPPNEIEYHPLSKRRLTKATCAKYGYGIVEYRGRKVQVAPYYKKGKLVAQHLRYPDKAMPWLGPTEGLELFGQHLWPYRGKRLVITEGEIDALSIYQSLGGKWPVVSVPNGADGAAKAIQAQSQWVDSYEEVVLAFDGDEKGKKAVDEVVEVLTPGKVKVFAYPGGYKDANELLQDGMAKAVVDGVFKAQTYRPDGIVPGTELRSEVLSDPEPGISIPYPVASQKLMGLRRGELTMVTAGSGIGKSTWVHELGYDLLVNKGYTVGVMALEEMKRITAKRYVGIHLNTPLAMSRGNLTDEQINKAFDETVGSNRFYLYDHWGSTNLDHLMSKLRYMVVGLGTDVIILDHVSIVVSGLDELQESERKLIDKLMTQLSTLVENTGAILIAVVHLKRPPGESKSYNEGKEVSLSSLRGSGSLEQLSHNVLALERDQQGDNPDQATVRVLKCRMTGNTGVADTVVYNKNTGRLLPADTAEFQSGGDENDDF